MGKEFIGMLAGVLQSWWRDRNPGSEQSSSARGWASRKHCPDDIVAHLVRTLWRRSLIVAHVIDFSSIPGLWTILSRKEVVGAEAQRLWADLSRPPCLRPLTLRMSFGGPWYMEQDWGLDSIIHTRFHQTLTSGDRSYCWATVEHWETIKEGSPQPSACRWLSTSPLGGPWPGRFNLAKTELLFCNPVPAPSHPGRLS